jgi:hypothetical protein
MILPPLVFHDLMLETDTKGATTKLLTAWVPYHYRGHYILNLLSAVKGHHWWICCKTFFRFPFKLSFQWCVYKLL